MALGEKRNGSVFATAAQRRDAAEYQVTSEPEVVPVVVDDTPQRTLNTDIGALGRAHNLFFTPSAEGRDFNSVLQEVQEYISGAYAALITGGGEDSKEQLMRYITKYLQDRRIAVAGMTQTELVDAIYSEMAEFGFLTRYIYADGIEEININSWRDTLMPTAVSLWAFLRPVRNPAAAAPHFRDLQPTKFQNTEEPYMGFNYAAEKKKFETLWARLRREYRAAGMSDTAIQKMHDFDWEVFKQERIYRLHTQDLGIGIFDEPSAEQEDKSALMKKFLESVSRWDDYTTASRYGWIEGIGDQRLVRVLKRLSISEKELLTKYCIEDKTQQEIAAEMGLSQRAVGKQLQQLKNFFRKF